MEDVYENSVRNRLTCIFPPKLYVARVFYSLNQFSGIMRLGFEVNIDPFNVVNVLSLCSIRYVYLHVLIF